MVILDPDDLLRWNRHSEEKKQTITGSKFSPEWLAVVRQSTSRHENGYAHGLKETFTQRHPIPLELLPI